MPRQSRTRLWVLLVLVLVLAVVGPLSYLGWRQSVPRVRLTSEPPKTLGHTTQATLVLEAARGNVTGVEVRVVQGGKTTLAAKADGPLGARAEVPLTIETSALGLREGSATLEVHARDDFWRPLTLDSGPVVAAPVTIDLTPPKLDILSSTRYVSNGGVALVVFRVDGASRSQVSVGTTGFPSFAYGPPERGARVALIALPYDFAAGTPLAIRAEDDAGNVTTRAIPHELKPRKFPVDRIEIRDNFLEAKVPELLPQRNPSQPLVEGFLTINRDQREQAEQEKRRIGAQTSATPLWDGAFVQPRNTKVFSNFAETRTYVYQGREIDRQVHYGYDLASTKQSPIPAANRGAVVFAGPLTIYGNTVVVDHGLGLQTLYAHMSSIDVKVGDTIDKGQTLGRSGTTGLAIGDHLHYETLVSGVSVTPVEWWDAKWIRDRFNLPLKTAGLPEIAGLDAPAAAASEDDAPKPRPRRRR
ncbi:MAG: M23 family metallopeptidase [Candidatus Rokubacteria bacterium]|nr:M23 family metallopeptidase [Candidatus Rokubacteria bacterium]